MPAVVLATLPADAHGADVEAVAHTLAQRHGPVRITCDPDGRYLVTVRPR